MEEVETLKSELTSQNRTTDLFMKRNKVLQQDVTSLRVKLAESERKRYNLSISRLAPPLRRERRRRRRSWSRS